MFVFDDETGGPAVVRHIVITPEDKREWNDLDGQEMRSELFTILSCAILFFVALVLCVFWVDGVTSALQLLGKDVTWRHSAAISLFTGAGLVAYVYSYVSTACFLYAKVVGRIHVRKRRISLKYTFVPVERIGQTHVFVTENEEGGNV